MVEMGNSGWSVSKFLKHFHEIYTCRISNTLDGIEDEAIYSEETAELADKEEMDDEFDAHTKDEQ